MVVAVTSPFTAPLHTEDLDFMTRVLDKSSTGVAQASQSGKVDLRRNKNL